MMRYRTVPREIDARKLEPHIRAALLRHDMKALKQFSSVIEMREAITFIGSLMCIHVARICKAT